MLLNAFTTCDSGRCACSSSLLVVDSSSSSAICPSRCGVVVVRVDDDLAAQRLDRHLAVGLQRHRHHHEVAGRGGLGRGGRSRARSELVHEVGRGSPVRGCC